MNDPNPRRRTSRWAAGGLALVTALAGAAGTAWAQGSSNVLEVRRSRTTGLASFVTKRGGGAIPVRLPRGRTRALPRDFLFQYGHLFGVTAPVKQTVRVKAETDALGHRHTTYAQVKDGVPVFSGLVKVHRNAAGEIIAANGDFYPSAYKVDTTPVLEASQAERITASVIPFTGLEVAHSELVIVDPGWYGDRPRGARLAYHIVLTVAAPPVREAFFVDARTGEILDQWSMIHTALYRAIFDAGGTGSQGTLRRSEGSPESGDFDVDAAYDYCGDVYDYYYRGFGRLGIDDDASHDSVIALVVHYGGDHPNAFWDPQLELLIFTDGMVADDVLAHEYTHGVTQYTANLIYQNQPGQLNESFSDIFGELVDLFNGDAAFAGTPGGPPNWPTHPTEPGLDTPNNLRTGPSWSSLGYPDGVRWLLGEDVVPAMGFVIRDMWDPTAREPHPIYGPDPMPDRANSPFQVCGVGDNGGVHSGMGIPCHAFAMVTDGKTFNGYTVNGIGPIKSGAAWYRALATYLTIASDFEDAYAALNQSAADLIGTAPNDPRTGLPSGSEFSTADAEEVDKALRAVELNTPGRCGEFDVLDPTPPTPCGAPATIFADDFESGYNGWTRSNYGPGATYNWALVSPLPGGREGNAWFCEDRETACDGEDKSALFSLVSPQISVPGAEELSFPVVAFDHYVKTEQSWDGGNVKLRVNNGSWQVLPAAAFFHNPYNPELLYSFTDGNTNPLADEPAFHGPGGEWGTSLIYIGDYVGGGETVQIRFDFGKDQCSGDVGWYIDDFELYDCDGSQDCNDNSIPDDVEIAEGPQTDVALKHPPLGSGLVPSDADYGGLGYTVRAQGFVLRHPKRIETIKIWGCYADNLSEANDFTVVFHEPTTPDESVDPPPLRGELIPGQLIAIESHVAFTKGLTGAVLYGALDEWEITLTLATPVPLDAGGYFVQIYNDTAADPDALFYWETADYLGAPTSAGGYGDPGEDWRGLKYNLTMELAGGTVGQDCEPNGVPDECEYADCNSNGVHDGCDIADGTSEDCEGNNVPDECEYIDCNTNNVHDGCDIRDETSQDCNTNTVPDECDVASGTSNDANGNGVPDECEDCNTNGVPDDMDISAGTSKDCNTNSTPDECDLAAGTSEDLNSNGVPDECDECMSTSDCDDNLYCNGRESCEAGVCLPGTDPCPGAKCDEEANACVQCLTNADCDDGRYCNGAETCSSGGQCQEGTDPCPEDLLCDEANQECVECLADSDCLDDNSCTADTCVNDVCVHTWREACDDFDEDGINNDDDACPNTPAGEEVDAAGCACSQLDDDGDGVNNCDDQCPDTPRDKSVDDAGCPVTLPVAEEEDELKADNPDVDFGNLDAGTGIVLIAPEPTVPTQASDEYCTCIWSVDGTGAFDPNPGCVTTYTPAPGDTLVTVSVGCTIDGETIADDFNQAIKVTGEPEDEEPIDDGDEAVEPDDGAAPDDEDVSDEPTPGQDVEPGAETPEEEQDDTGSGSARSSRPSGGGTCGLLGMFNLACLLAGLALLRRSAGR